MKCATAAALVCIATTATAVPTPKPFFPPSDLLPGFGSAESFYKGMFNNDGPAKGNFGKKFDHKKMMMAKPYKYEDALKWDGSGLEPYDWGFNWDHRPYRPNDKNESEEDRKKKEEERRKKEEEERKKKEDEDKNKNNKDYWKIKDFKRNCASGGNGDNKSKDKDCIISFEIEQPGKSSSKCEYKIGNLRSPISNHKCDNNGNEYTIGAQWSDFFGPDKGFTTLSVVDQKNKRIVWPAYSDTELENDKKFSPDKTYLSQEIPK